jgi:hypothetical protein
MMESFQPVPGLLANRCDAQILQIRHQIALFVEDIHDLQGIQMQIFF